MEMFRENDGKLVIVVCPAELSGPTRQHGLRVQLQQCWRQYRLQSQARYCTHIPSCRLQPLFFQR